MSDTRHKSIHSIAHYADLPGKNGLGESTHTRVREKSDFVIVARTKSYVLYQTSWTTVLARTSVRLRIILTL